MKKIRYRTLFRDIALSSCRTDEALVCASAPPAGTAEAVLTRSVRTPSEGTLTVGKKLKNPFSLDNMQEALVSMFRRDPHSPTDGKMTGSILEEAARLRQTSLRPSHLYVKITPDNPQELDLLYKSPTLRALKTNILTDRQALGVETDAANDYFEFYGI